MVVVCSKRGAWSVKWRKYIAEVSCQTRTSLRNQEDPASKIKLSAAQSARLREESRQVRCICRNSVFPSLPDITAGALLGHVAPMWLKSSFETSEKLQDKWASTIDAQHAGVWCKCIPYRLSSKCEIVAVEQDDDEANASVRACWVNPSIGSRLITPMMAARPLARRSDHIAIAPHTAAPVPPRPERRRTAPFLRLY